MQEERTRLVDAQEKRTKLLARIAGGEPVNGAEGGAGAAPAVLRNFAGAGGGGGGEPEKEDKYSSVA